MGIFAILFGVPLLTLVVLAMLPAGRIALFGHLGALVLWGIAAAAIYPLPPAQGPDDWFHGIEVIPLWSGLCATLLTGLAQVWRWQRLRSGHKPPYLLALLGVVLALLVLFFTVVRV